MDTVYQTEQNKPILCFDLKLIWRSCFKRDDWFIIWRDIYLYVIKRSFHGTLTEQL